MKRTPTLRQRLGRVIRGAGEIVETTARSVADSVERDGPARTARNAFKAAVEMGRDAGQAAGEIALRLVRASRLKGSSALEAVTRGAKDVVGDTLRMGGDAARAASGFVKGTLHGAKELGVDAAKAASAAALGALEAAEEGGALVAARVRRALGADVGMKRRAASRRPRRP
jgi:hypothetical protein